MTILLLIYLTTPKIESSQGETIIRSCHIPGTWHDFSTVNTRSSHPEVFLRKGVLKICNKFTGEYQCWSVISIKLLSNFIEITLRHGCCPVNLLHIVRTSLPKNTSGRLLLEYQCWRIVAAQKKLFWLLMNCASEELKSCVKQLCQQLLKIHVSDCWTIVPVTVEKPCRWLLNNMPATIEQSHQWLLKNCASECWTIASPGKHKQIKRY